MVGRNILDLVDDLDFEILAPPRKELDLSDYETVVDWIKTKEPDGVIHAAGHVGGIQANLAQPVAFLTKNIDLSKNLILAARASNVKFLLNLGSSCMYPRNADNPLIESSILSGSLEPTNEGYAIAKIFSLRLCEYIRKENQSLFYKTLVPCNLFGKYDKFDPSNSHLIPAIIHKTHKAKVDQSDIVEIWGDGSARREFMLASDFAKLVTLSLKNIEKIPNVMNIGLGYDYSINEYYKCVASVVGFEGKFSYNLEKPVGMTRKLVSIDWQKKFGWICSTPLEEGIRLTYRHYLEDVIK